MDISKLIRAPEKIHAALTELKDGRLVTKEKMKIYIPIRFEEHGLATIGVETKIVGICAYVLQDKYYAVSVVNALMRIEPSIINKVDIHGVGYYEFVFNPGAAVLADVNLVRIDTVIYKIYDELIAKGRVPWYIDYMEFAKIFDTAKSHADANVGQNHEVTELMISLISRDNTDRNKYYRQVVKTIDDLHKKPPAYIPLRSVTYTATNTTNKLAGSYFNEGLVSALVNPSDRKERIEDILLR